MAPVSEDDLLILEERCLRDDREKRIISRIVKMTNLTKSNSRRKSIEKTCSLWAVGLVHENSRKQFFLNRKGYLPKLKAKGKIPR